MKRIAFVSTNDMTPWSGSEELWAQTAISMAQQGFTVGVNIKGWKPTPKKIQALERANCCIVRRWYDSNRIKKLALTGLTYKLFYGWLHKFDPDLVVVSQGYNFENIRWMEACLRRNIPYAVIIHAATESAWPTDEVAAKALKVYQAAKQNFFVSQRNLELTVKQLATELDNTKIIRNPYKVPYDASPPWPRDEGVLKLACVGRLDPDSKGQDLLFEIMRAEKWRSRPLEVTLFGDGYSRNFLKRLRDLWKLDNVKFGGFVDNIEAIWASHHALVLPSRYEGLPLAVVEAMLCGRFCIVTDVAGNTELVEDNVNGFVAIAPKAECLDDAMERAWQRRNSWREIGQAASMSVRKVIPRAPIDEFVSELKLLLD
ncbi:glycosyltransferase family 4 protein [Chroococcidiopsis sp. CCMEE 29]|uniref:glycosyltransferase family 4 protein n=1 Tax=Chroococcidiopsis sp. CCMEE 29 TaxID=155894 RepID=UPI0020226C52|nr:glycosyltransferase family 4 protein [Chroococcidiopsis sp. CCMEE 29]